MDLEDRRQNIGEDYWWFAGKMELSSILLKTILKKRKGIILNVGCGTGEDLGIISKYGKTIAIDISKETLSKVAHTDTIQLIRGDAENLPFREDVFDIVLMQDVIEHLENDEKSIQQVFTVMNGGGHLIISVPAIPFLFSGHDVGLGHLRRYTKKTFLNLVNDRFIVKRFTYWNTFLFPPIMVFRLMKKIVYIRRTNKTSDIWKLHPFLNKIFSSVLRLENTLIKNNINLPIGVSLIGVFKKKVN
jgi:SAM-dependent methyltransferase